jgi:hypothetical protein
MKMILDEDSTAGSDDALQGKTSPREISLKRGF